MNEPANPYQMHADTFAQDAGVNERADFIRKTYLHLLGAVMAFACIQFLIFQAGYAERIAGTLLGFGQYSWLFVLGAFMVVSWIANSWAQSATSPGMQYAGLSLFVVAEAVIFVPLLYYASQVGGQGVIPTAATITLLMFGGLTAIVFLTAKDFSFLGSFLWMGALGAMGLIVCGILFGFTLGPIFTVAMIVLMCGFILYDTSNVLHHYRIGQHVAASLALFASIATLFWYVLQLVMSMSRE